MRGLQNLTWIQLVAFIGTLGGLVQTWWISLRQNYAAHNAQVKKLSKDGVPRLMANVRFWRPYALILLCYAAVALAAVWPRNLTVNRHEITTISSSSKEDSANLVGCTRAELYSSAEHFSVTINGVFYGPELRDLRKEYGDDLRALRVYAIVSEASQPDKSDLLWIQANESGSLHADGQYTIGAFFGGTGLHSAGEGDNFSVRIYVPKDVHSRPSVIPYDSTESLPAYVFLSAPVTVRTLRRKPPTCAVPAKMAP